MPDIARLIAQAFATARRYGLEVSVTHEAITGTDAYGAPTYATGTTVKGVMDDRVRRWTNSNGDVRTVRSSCVLPALPLIAEDDRLTLPDGSRPPILEVRAVRGASGILAHEVLFGVS